MAQAERDGSEVAARTVEMTPAMDVAWRSLRRDLHARGLVAAVERFDCERLTITLVTRAGWTWSDIT